MKPQKILFIATTILALLAPSLAQDTRTITLNKDDTYSASISNLLDLSDITGKASLEVDKDAFIFSKFKEAVYGFPSLKVTEDKIKRCVQPKNTGENTFSAVCGDTKIRSFKISTATAEQPSKLQETRTPISLIEGAFPISSWTVGGKDLAKQDFYAFGVDSGASAPFKNLNLMTLFGTADTATKTQIDISKDTQFQNLPKTTGFLNGDKFSVFTFDAMNNVKGDAAPSTYIYYTTDTLTTISVQVTKETFGGEEFSGFADVWVYPLGEGKLKTVFSVNQDSGINLFACDTEISAEVKFSKCSKVKLPGILPVQSKIVLEDYKDGANYVTYSQVKRKFTICKFKIVDGPSDCVESPRQLPFYPDNIPGALTVVKENEFQFSLINKDTKKSVVNVHSIKIGQNGKVNFLATSDRGPDSFIVLTSGNYVLFKSDAYSLYQEATSFKEARLQVSARDLTDFTTKATITVTPEGETKKKTVVIEVNKMNSVYKGQVIQHVGDVTGYVDYKTNMGYSRRNFVGNDLRFTFMDTTVKSMLKKSKSLGEKTFGFTSLNFDEQERIFLEKETGDLAQLDMLSDTFGLAVFKENNKDTVKGVSCERQSALSYSCSFTGQAYEITGNYRFKYSSLMLTSPGAIFFDEKLDEETSTLTVQTVFFSTDTLTVTKAPIFKIEGTSKYPHHIFYMLNGGKVKPDSYILVSLANTIPIFKADASDFSKLSVSPYKTLTHAEYKLDKGTFCPKSMLVCSHNDMFFEVANDCGFGDVRILKGLLKPDGTVAVKPSPTINRPDLGQGDKDITQTFCPSGDEFHIWNSETKKIYSTGTGPDNSIHHWELDQYGITTLTRFICLKDLSSFVILGTDKKGNGKGALAYGNMQENTAKNIHRVFDFPAASVDSFRAYGATRFGTEVILSYLENNKAKFLRADLNGPSVVYNALKSSADKNLKITLSNGSGDGVNRSVKLKVIKFETTVDFKPKENNVPEAGKSYKLSDLATLKGPIFSASLNISDKDKDVKDEVKFTGRIEEQTPSESFKNFKIKSKLDKMKPFGKNGFGVFESKLSSSVISFRSLKANTKSQSEPFNGNCDEFAMASNSAGNRFSAVLSCNKYHDPQIYLVINEIPPSRTLLTSTIIYKDIDTDRTDQLSADYLSEDEIIISRARIQHGDVAVMKYDYKKSQKTDLPNFKVKTANFVREAKTTTLIGWTGTSFIGRYYGADGTFDFEVGNFDQQVEEFTCHETMNEDKTASIGCSIMVPGTFVYRMKFRLDAANKKVNEMQIKQFKIYPGYVYNQIDCRDKYTLIKGVNIKDETKEIFVVYSDESEDMFSGVNISKFSNSAGLQAVLASIEEKTSAYVISGVKKDQQGETPVSKFGLFNLSEMTLELKKSFKSDDSSKMVIEFSDESGKVLQKNTVKDLFKINNDEKPKSKAWIYIVAIVVAILIIGAIVYLVMKKKSGGDDEDDYQMSRDMEDEDLSD